MKPQQYIAQHPELFREDFAAWIDANPDIWEQFKTQALRAAQFRQHYSARTIVEYIRHSTIHRQVEGPYKINDHCVPDLARLFAGLYPEHDQFFEFRKRPARAAA